jgi:glycosyltransferase involved in cell wall biosynthesis
MISVIIPAYNEEKLLPETFAALRLAVGTIDAEIIVVDNESTDSTREIAVEFGARVISESVHNIARVRNAGAEVATGDILVFVDADTRVDATLVERILAEMSDPKCLGGGVAVKYEPTSRKLNYYYLEFCMFIGRLFRMRQGALQFCRADTFRELGGFDATIYVGEDVEFQWRLARLARRSGSKVVFIDHPPVVTSSRRFERFGLAKTLFFSHPIVIFLFWRVPIFWADWYKNAIR